MTEVTPSVLRVRVTDDTRLDRQLAGSDARVVIVEVQAQPTTASSALGNVCPLLASPELISVGVARGVVDEGQAAVLASCDFVVAGADAAWTQAAVSVVQKAVKTRIPPRALEELAALVGPVPGTEMLRLGLVVEVAADPTQAAQLLATELMTVAPQAIAGAKHMVDAAAEQTLDEALALESELQTACLVSPEHRRIMAGKAGPSGACQS